MIDYLVTIKNKNGKIKTIEILVEFQQDPDKEVADLCNQIINKCPDIEKIVSIENTGMCE